MDPSSQNDFSYYFYHYFVEWHPVYYLYQLGKQYTTDDVNTGIWLAASILGIATWFGLARALAEIPGRRHGNMLVWWIIFAGLHIFSIPVYLIYEVIASATKKHYQDRRQTKFADRTATEIRSGRKDEGFKHIPKDFK